MTFVVSEEAKRQLEEIAQREGMTVDELTRQVFAKMLEAPEILEHLTPKGTA